MESSASKGDWNGHWSDLPEMLRLKCFISVKSSTLNGWNYLGSMWWHSLKNVKKIAVMLSPFYFE